MRSLADADRIRRFLEALGRVGAPGTRAWLTGGATAVLLGWRASTVDIDLTIEPEQDAVFRAIARLKDELQVNVELVSPAHFIPALPGWESRSPHALQAGALTVYHYDLYAQALAKIERGHAQDVSDVHEMLQRGLVEPARLKELFESIVNDLPRYPAVDPVSFRRAVFAVTEAQP